jgi:mRNA-degrading endonuclease RelE of RelBE toxin-antitoxin system
MGSFLLFSWVCVSQSLCLYSVFCRPLLVAFFFHIRHFMICPSSNYGVICDYDKRNISVVICDYDKQNISVVICDYDKQNISVVICDYDKQNISVVICHSGKPSHDDNKKHELLSYKIKFSTL